jgi:hypothetical protein
MGSAMVTAVLAMKEMVSGRLWEDLRREQKQIWGLE